MRNNTRQIIYKLILFVSIFICGRLEAQPYSFEKRYGTPQRENALQMIPCKNGDYITLGWRTGSFHKEILIIRLDYAGNMIWERSLKDSATAGLLPIRCIETLDNGFCILANPYLGSFNPVISCVTLIKLDSQGQLEWITQATDQWRSRYFGTDITESPDGSIYVSGSLWPSSNFPSLMPYVIKYNPNGEYLWYRVSYSNPYVNYTISKISANSDSTILLGINGQSCSYIVELDSSGITTSSTLYRDSVSLILNDWIIDSTGFIKTLLFTNGNSQGVTLCTLNPLGNSVSAIYASKSGYTLQGVQLLKADNGYVALLKTTGSSNSIVTDWSNGILKPNAIQIGINIPIDPSSFVRKPDGSLFVYGSLNPSSTSLPDLHLIKTDITTNGILPLTGCAVDTALLSVSPITIFDSISSFVFVPDSLFPYPTYLTDSLLLFNEYTDCMVTGIETQNNQDENLSIFPNPASNFVTIQLDKVEEENVQIKILDVLGQTVIENREYTNSGKFEKRLDLTDLSDGIYLIVVRVGEKNISRKIVVQR